MVRVIAEAGTCAGEIEWAHEAVDAAAEAGCWGFKVQILSDQTLVAPDTARYDRLNGPSTQNEAFANQIPRTAWAEVQSHCQEVGLEFFASVWDHSAVDTCEALGVNFYKIGSAEINHLDLLRYVADTGKRVILSTGASTLDEIDQGVSAFEHNKLIVMACTLSYPCEPEHAYIGRLNVMRSDPWMEPQVEAWGYSDHTRLIDSGGLAVAAGARYLEKHFTITPGQGGDHDFAFTPQLMAAYIQAANRAYRLCYPDRRVVSPEGVLVSELPGRMLARRSLHAIDDLEEGEPLFVGANVAWLRPSGGIPPDEHVRDVVAARDIGQGTPIRWEDVKSVVLS